MLLLTRRSSRHKQLKLILWLITASIVAFVGWKSWQLGVPRYKAWKQQRALAQAKEFIAARDPQNAQVALEVALKTIPGDVDALRVAADMLEQVGAAQAVRLRRDISRLRPDSAEDAALLVYTAMSFRDFNTARDALAAMTPEVAGRTPALRAALAFALATDNRPIADAAFDRLKAQLPDDVELRFAHATLRLKHPGDTQRAAARAEVERLAAEHPQLALKAYRALASTALQQRDYATARRALESAGRHPEAVLNDQLQLANLDLLIDKQPFPEVFARLTPRVGKTAAEIGQFVQWLLVQRRVSEAASWLATLPADADIQPVVAAARADLSAARSEWDELLRLLERGAWGPLPEETIRLVSAARAIDGQGRPVLRAETWGLALQSTKGQLGALRTLHRLAVLFGWQPEAETTLWSIARAHPNQTWSHQALFDLYHAQRNTANMRDVMNTLRQADPSVARYQHDWAVLALLLDPSATWNAPKRTLEELHQADPANPNYLASYAFALALAGKKKESLEMLARLPEPELSYPPRLPYLAYIYGAAGNAPALTKVAAAATNGNYLPEEFGLIRRAQEIVTARPPPPPKEKSAKTAPAAGGSPSGKP